jgi:flavodoxin
VSAAIIYYSYHHGNTEKIARRMAGPLGAKLLTPEKVDAKGLEEFDLIGFGSGIYFSKHHRSLFKLVDALPSMNSKKAFIFSTAGRGDPWMDRNHRELKAKLEGKGFIIVGEFTSYAFDTFFLLWLIGGINKGRPNEGDLKRAEDFAKGLIGK